MKRSSRTLLFSLLISIFLIASGCSSAQGDDEEVDKASLEIMDKNKEDTTTYKSGDFIYEPKDDEISFDETAEVYFYKNLINVYLDSAVSEAEATELADKVEGDVVGIVQGDVNGLQIQVEADSYDELNQLADEYKADDLVKLVSLSTPLFSSQTEIEEDTTSLEEFIETPSVSEFIEKNADKFEPVQIGMVEAKDLNEEDKESYTNSLTVNKNDTDLVSVQFNDKEAKENKENKAITEFKIVTEIKEQLKNNATIINNSFKNQVMSKEKYKDENDIKQLDSSDLSYESYIKANEHASDNVSVQLIIALDELLASENNDFLIIQEVVQGYELAEDETEIDDKLNAEQVSYFANINERTYELAEEQNKEGIENELTEMLNHIIVVGDAKETENIHFGETVDVVSPSENEIISAGPTLSSVTALIKSFHPEMTSDELKEELFSSSMNEVTTKDKDTEEAYPVLNLAGFMYADTLKNYDDLLDMYQTAITEQWEYEKLFDANIGPYADERPAIPTDYGYELKDINGNGKPELILGIDQSIQEIYTLIDDKPEKIVGGNLRSEINIQHDGTIIESDMNPGSGEITETLSELLVDGSKKEIKSQTYPFTEEVSKDYDDSDLISHSFKKIVSKDANETDEKEEKAEKTESKKENEENDSNEALTDDELKGIVETNYNEIENALKDMPLNDLYDQHHDYEDGQEMWASGINPDTPFYKDVKALFYPKVEDLVTEKEGMQFIIDEKFADFHNPAGISFFTPFNDIEILSKETDTFKIKQIIEEKQDIDTSYYEFIIDYKKEDGKWKLAGGEDVSDWQRGQ